MYVYIVVCPLSKAGKGLLHGALPTRNRRGCYGQSLLSSTSHSGVYATSLSPFWHAHEVVHVLHRLIAPHRVSHRATPNIHLLLDDYHTTEVFSGPSGQFIPETHPQSKDALVFGRRVTQNHLEKSESALRKNPAWIFIVGPIFVLESYS